LENEKQTEEKDTTLTAIGKCKRYHRANEYERNGKTKKDRKLRDRKRSGRRWRTTV